MKKCNNSLGNKPIIVGFDEKREPILVNPLYESEIQHKQSGYRAFYVLVKNNNLRKSDLELFCDWDQNILDSSIKIFILETNVISAVLLTKLKIFSSIGQAKKAGWTELIPEGWSEWSIGKAKVFILNPW